MGKESSGFWRRKGRVANWRQRGTAGVLSVGLVAGALAGGLVHLDASPAEAVFATDGSGLYQGSIDWFEWSDTPGQRVPGAGMTKTNNRVIGGQTLATTCSITDITGEIKTYQPGAYGGDGLDDLYNVGGVGTANQMNIGVANYIGGEQASFRVSCTATLNGEHVPLQGLVFADAEASTSLQGEFIEALPDQAPTWRIIDRYRDPSCNTSTVATVGPDGSMRLAPDGDACFRMGQGGGPTAVGFMEGSTSALMTVKGGGVSAVALGVVLQTDFGDAPASYGEAGALLAPGWTGGEVGVGSTPVSGNTFQLGTPGQPVTRLGATVDSEAAPIFSDDALGDDRDGNSQSDEDAIANPGKIHVTPGDGTYVIKDVACTGPGFVAGWIDWNANGQFDAGERSNVVECSGSAVDLEWSIPDDARTSDTFMRLRIAGTEAEASVPTGLSTSGEVEDYAVSVQLPELTVTKESTASSDAAAGDVVTYTVTTTNVGETDFTEAYPASLSDDLSDVLDDATYNDDADVTFSDGSTGPSPAVTDGKLTWSGPLRAGETATFTYSVTLTNAGDGAVVNNACVPAALSANDENCASTRTELPKLVIAKTSDVSDLPENGGKVTYQVTVTNQGPGDATAENPASFVDDLTDVLDDGDFVDGSLSASAGTAARDGNELSWSGPLAASESVTVTYEVEYDSAKGGDHKLVNVACLPADLAADPDRLCRQVQIPGAALQQWKTADPASGAVAAGDEITYTLHFRNTGQAAVDINNSDDLVAVVDDADLIAGPTSSNGDLTATLDGTTIRLGGSVAAGSEETVSYTVKVRAFADRGDSVLTNALTDCEANDTALCDPVVHEVPHLKVEKSSDVAESRTGDTVTYTIKVTNDGTAAYTEQNPAAFVDDLTGVLDDASYNDDAEASVGSVSYASPKLSWEGPLAADESATITYSVKVTNAGDHQLLNTVCAPIAGEDPACDDNTVLLPNVLVTKSVDPETGTSVQPGQTVTYTLTFRNDGLAPAPIDYTDDLSDVLDDAEFGTGPTVSDPALTAVKVGEEIGITGDLAPGQTVTASYTAVVKADGERGNNVIGNVLADSGITDPKCGDDGVSCTENPIGELVTWKTVDPASGATLRAGDTATYTLHFENTGKADVTVNHDDVLTQVQDDANVTVQPHASGDALTASEITDGRFTVTGTLGAGESATVSYTVQVKADGERGDDRLANFLVPQGEEPPASCDVTEGKLPNCTVNHVSDVTVVKSSDPESGTKVNPGDVVTYTLTFTNLSKNSESAPVAVDYTDHMKNVLDDATLLKDPVSSNASLEAKASGDTIRVQGDVAAGEVVTVTYTVKVKAYAEQGDHSLENVVAVTGETPVCVDGSELCTTHDVPPVKPTPPGLALTGSDSMFAVGATVLAGLMLAAGAVLFTRRRKSSTEETSSLM